MFWLPFNAKGIFLCYRHQQLCSSSLASHSCTYENIIHQKGFETFLKMYKYKRRLKHFHIKNGRGVKMFPFPFNLFKVFSNIVVQTRA